MKSQLVLWYDSDLQVNAWRPEYTEILRTAPIFSNLREGTVESYFSKCVAIQDFNGEPKSMSDFEKTVNEADTNVYVISVHQLIPALYYGIGRVVEDISALAMRLIQEGRLTLVILMNREAWNANIYLPHMAARLEQYGMIAQSTRQNIKLEQESNDISKVYVISANEKMEEEYNKTEISKSFKFAGFFTSHSFEHITKIRHDDTYTDKHSNYTARTPTNDFLSLNRLQRPHRIALYSELDRLGLLSNSKFSFIGESNTNEDSSSDIIKLDLQTIDEVHTECHQKDSVPYIHFKDMIDNNRLVKKYVDKAVDRELMNAYPVGLYPDTFMSIVTETVFAANYKYITEKTYRCMINYHPFILMSGVGCLKMLREHGYLTFPEMFDESYDDIEDPVERFAAIIEQVRMWCSLGHEEKLERFQSVEYKLIHNNKLFFERAKVPDTSIFEEIGRRSNEKVVE